MTPSDAEIVAELEALYTSFPTDTLQWLHQETTRERAIALRARRMLKVGECNGRLAIITRVLRERGLEA